MITLTLVLDQVGTCRGIALIIGVDRLLDMLRTAVNGPAPQWPPSLSSEAAWIVRSSVLQRRKRDLDRQIWLSGGPCIEQPEKIGVVV